MTQYDRQIFFTALAFIAVVLKDGENLQEGSGRKIKILAELLGDFCVDNVPSPFAGSMVSPTDKSDLTGIDATVERHIKELRDEKRTVLPKDRATLYKLYERLQLRKVRRINAVLFEEVSDEKLADFVLSQIDEEVDEHGEPL